MLNYDSHVFSKLAVLYRQIVAAAVKRQDLLAIDNVIKEGVEAGGSGSGANPPGRVGDAIGPTSLIEVGVSGWDL